MPTTKSGAQWLRRVVRPTDADRPKPEWGGFRFVPGRPFVVACWGRARCRLLHRGVQVPFIISKGLSRRNDQGQLVVFEIRDAPVRAGQP